MHRMSDERPDVIGSLPSTRPHRRSDKRGPAKPDTEKQPAAAAEPKPTKPAAGKPAAKKPAAKKPAAKKPAAKKPAAKKPAAKKPAAKKPPVNVRTRATTPPPPPSPPRPADDRPADEQPGTLETVVQAAAELTELGLRAGARALRGAVSRLPRP